MKNKKISCLDDDNYQDQVLRDSSKDSVQQYQLKFSPKELLKLWLKKLLPPSKSQLSIKCEKNQILLCGKQVKCEAYLQKLQQFQQNYTLNKIMFQVEQPPLQKIQYEMKDEFKLKIYRPKVVEKTINNMISSKIKPQQMAQLMEKIFANGDNFVMLICLKQYHEEVIKTIDNINLKESKIRNQQSDVKTQKKKKYQKVQSKESPTLSSKITERMTQSRQETYETRKPRYAKRQSNQQQQFIFCQMFQTDALNIEHFSNWIKRNQLLTMEDFQIKQKPNHVILSLKKKGSKDKQRLNKLEIYIKYEKIIQIEKIEEDQIRPFLEKNHKPPGVLLDFIAGYIPSNTPPPRLRYAIKQNLLDKPIKNYRAIYALKFIGLLSELNRIEQDIAEYIDKLEPASILEKVKIEIPNNLIPYITDKSIQELMMKTIQDDKNFSHMLIEEPKINMDVKNCSIVLQISLKGQYKQQCHFLTQSYKEILKKKISVHTLTNIISNESYNQLKKSYNIFKTDQGYLLITHIDSIGNEINNILNYLNSRTVIKEYTTVIEKRHSTPISELFEQLKKRKPDLVNVKFFKQEFQQNKEKITFLGSSEDLNVIQLEVIGYLKHFSENEVSEKVQISEMKADFLKEKGLNMLLSYTLKEGIVINVDQGKGKSMIQIFNKHIAIEIFTGYQTILLMQNNDVLYLQNAKDLQQIKDKHFQPFIKALQFQKSQQGFLQSLWKKLSEINIQCIDSKKRLLICGENLISNIQKKISDKKNVDLRNKKVFLLMPKENKEKFMKKLLISLEKVQQNIKITIICPDTTKDLATQVPVDKIFAKTQNKAWYTTQYDRKVYYSSQACKKINDSIQKKAKHLILTNQDLNLLQSTHAYFKKQKVLVHLRSQKQFPVQVRVSNQYYFNIKGQSYRIPPSEQLKIIQSTKQQVQVSIGLYKIDFENMIQTNIFSGFKRDVICDKVQGQANTLAQSYQYKLKQMLHYLTFNFNKQKTNAYEKVKKQINDYLQKKLIKRQVLVTKAFETLDKQLFIKQASSFNIILNFIPQTKKIVFQSYDEQKIDLFQKFIKSHIQKENEKIFELPKTWQPQTMDIQLFQVPKNSAQFTQIQSNFSSVGPIKKLERIQNKIIYKKYVDEKKHVQQLNNGKQMKQTMLYHGTRATDPSLIYMDKEQSFNINYTSDSNLLGKGIYFAVNPVYSHNYRHTVKNLIGGDSQMFLCRVLIGQSQKLQGTSANSQIKDTTYKNQKQKLRYESTTAYLVNSDIYVVYKNRRAYPQYLITY